MEKSDTNPDSESKSDLIDPVRWGSMVKAMEAGDIAGALYMLKAMAKEGSTSAMVEIGVIYETGPGLVDVDLEEAMHWYQKAADLGSVDGLLALARHYLTADGLPQDYQLARLYYEDVIDEFEDRRALFGLGWIYHRGLGVPVDLDKAEHFYLRAKEAGHLIAAKWLADIGWAKEKYFKAITSWLSAVFCIWKVALTDRKSFRLHRQL